MQESLSSPDAIQPGAAAPSERPEDRTWILHVFALSSLVFAQPLFDLLSSHAEFFVVRRSGTAEIVALAAVLLVVLPGLLVLPVALTKWRFPRLGNALLGGVNGALAALFVLLTLTRASLLDGGGWLVAGTAAGLAVAWAYFRLAAVRMLVTYLGLAVVVVPAVFFLHPRMLKVTIGATSADLHESGASTPIVFVLFDEFSLTALLDADRRIDAASYPNLAALAEGSTWFSNVATVSDATELAVPAILSGVLPQNDRLPILADYPHNLFTLFGGDYKLWANEPITQLCPATLNTAAGGRQAPVSSLASLAADVWVVYQHLLLPPRFAAHLPVISDRWQGFGRGSEPGTARQDPSDPAQPAPEEARPKPADFSSAALAALSRDRQDELRRLLDALDAETDQALYFLHVLLPHTPWEYLPSGKTYTPQSDRIPGLDKDRWLDDEALVTQAYQRYLLQVRYLDRWIGELVERLRTLGLYDRALLVLAADHGVSFRPGDTRRSLSETNSHDVIPVPLLVKAPGQSEGRVVERPVSTLDVVPTVLDLLDVDSPWPLEGRSAFDDAAPVNLGQVRGKYRSFEVEPKLHEDKYTTLDWKLATFDAESDLLWAGTLPELYGRRSDEIGWREQNKVRLELKGASLLQQVDTGSAYSPAFVSGALETEADDTECCEVAVAVNGTLYATVRTFGAPPDNLQFTALVPDAAFTEGANQVQVFRIRRDELELLGSSGQSTYNLVLGAGDRVVAVRRQARGKTLSPSGDQGGETLSPSGDQGGETLSPSGDQGGETLPIRAGALRGYFSTERLSGKLRVTGWAVDVEAGAAPRQILVFHDGEMVYSGLTTKVRDDIIIELGLTRPVRSAFELDLPESRVPEVAHSGLRLFAVSDAAASELGFFYKLGKNADGRVTKIEVTNGRRIPIVPGVLAGGVETVREETVPGRGERLIVQGWAANVAHHEEPEMVLVFAGDKAVYASRSFVERSDVAWTYALPEALRMGIDYRVDMTPAGGGGAGALSVFAVSQEGEAVLLPKYLRLEGAGGSLEELSFTLESGVDGSAKRLRVSGGDLPVTEIPMVAGALEGYVDRMEPIPGGRLRLGGWVVDSAHREPPEAVLVFAGGRRVHASRTFVDRGDVAELFDAPQLMRSGFDYELEVPPDLPEADLLVVAVSKRGEATGLPILRPAQEAVPQRGNR